MAACKYGISLLVFNFISHSWEIKLNTWSFVSTRAHALTCTILEDIPVELVLFHCILLSYSFCYFQQLFTRSRFTDRRQRLKILSRWPLGLQERMVHEPKKKIWPTEQQKCEGMKCTYYTAFLVGWQNVRNQAFAEIGYRAGKMALQNNFNYKLLFWPRPHDAGEILKRTITGNFGCVFEETRQRNHMSKAVTSSFSKSFVFKRYSVHTKIKSQRFQVSPIWRTFSKSSVFVTD